MLICKNYNTLGRCNTRCWLIFKSVYSHPKISNGFVKMSR
jgi:hypothetical protein